MIERCKIKEYDGTMESAKDLVDDMKLENHQYFLDVRTRAIYVHRDSMRFSPGDCYTIRLPEEFPAVDR